MTKRVIKQTETQAVVKCYGTGSTDTIDLDVDLLSTTMSVSGTPTVNILSVTWFVSDAVGDKIVVTRNSVPIFNLYQNGQMDFSGEWGWAEDTQNTQDIVVTITGTGGIYLSLRKAAGFVSKIEPHRFGPYDNVAAVGS